MILCCRALEIDDKQVKGMRTLDIRLNQMWAVKAESLSIWWFYGSSSAALLTSESNLLSSSGYSNSRALSNYKSFD